MTSPAVSHERIAGHALRHVEGAQAEILDGTYSSAAAAQIGLRLKVVSELLALIAYPTLSPHLEAPKAE